LTKTTGIEGWRGACRKPAAIVKKIIHETNGNIRLKDFKKDDEKQWNGKPSRILYRYNN
jgi:hypothetical protein